MASSTTNPPLRWHDARWLAEATAWIEARVEPTGTIEQPHVYPWATALRVPTANGVVWFKACIGELAHEISTLELVAPRRPELVTRVLESDRSRGWMLLDDAGIRLRELDDEPGQLERWERAAAAYGELQVDVADDADLFIAGGVPDRRDGRLVEQFERLLGDESALAPHGRDGLSAEEIARVRKLVPRVAADVAHLDRLALPATIQHDDFHDGNVFVRNGAFRIIDWGDACVVNPLLSLHVMLGALAFRRDVPADAPEVTRVRDAYLEPFTALRPREELVAALPAVDRLGLVGGAVKWHEIVGFLPEETREPYADAVPYKLRQLLELCA